MQNVGPLPLRGAIRTAEYPGQNACPYIIPPNFVIQTLFSKLKMNVTLANFFFFCHFKFFTLCLGLDRNEVSHPFGIADKRMILRQFNAILHKKKAKKVHPMANAATQARRLCHKGHVRCVLAATRLLRSRPPFFRNNGLARLRM